ncbi:MAG: IS66 family transposase [Muribaculum sp.]|nr:IS66 family transposase [Muribaculum sp.]
MGKNELIEFLQRQNGFLQGKLDEALASVNSLTLANEKLTATVDELRLQIASLEAVLKGKDNELDKEKAARQAVQRLQGSSSEKQPKPHAKSGTSIQEGQKPEKKCTNNGAKRKTHPECEVEIIEIEPDSPDFNPDLAKYIGTVDVVRYMMKPTRFIKVIYKVKKYVQDEKIFKGNAPAAPLLNSQYTSSFIAGLTELRYLHGMPLENAVDYFRSHGFDLDKGTAQKLISKTKVMLENLYKALRNAIVEDKYICGDETYQKVRLQVATSSGKRIKKGYIWVFVGMTTGLVYFFYDDGSRSAEVFEREIMLFRGAFQCDYYSGYRHIGIGELAGIFRLPCIQHIKRKFLDIKDNPQAQEIAKLFGLLYHFEHKHKIGKDGWTEEQHLQWRQRYSKVMLEKIHMRLIAVKDRPGIPPDDPLLAATEHALKQWDEIPRIFASPTYRLDNNEVERINRYISLTRKRLTIGSHTGAETAALYHSLAITCHRCGVNLFEYFCDIIDRCAAWPPNTPIEKYRDLLPDRWQPTQK